MLLLHLGVDLRRREILVAEQIRSAMSARLANLVTFADGDLTLPEDRQVRREPPTLR